MSLTGYNPYTYAPGFRNQEFHHAVLSVSGTWHTLYLDGVRVAQNLSGGNVFASYQTITNTVIGAQTTLSQAFQGTIGDVRVYNYAIQQPLVTSLYRDRELVVYYPFDTSVNSLTPNYATLVYDASLIGQPLISASSGANVGSGALALTNSATTPATQYVKTTPGIAGQIGWTLDVTHGITIACWINVAGVAGRVQRIFDIPLSVGTKGLSVDISGTNMLYSGWNEPLSLSITTTAPTTTISGYKFVTLTSSNTVTINRDTTMHYLVVGGGGGGGHWYGGGGGGGGVKIGSITIPSADTLTITVGNGGASNTTQQAAPFPTTNNGQPGNNSTIAFNNNPNLILDVSGGRGSVFYTSTPSGTSYGQPGGKSGYPQNNAGGEGGNLNAQLAGGGGGGGAGGPGNNRSGGVGGAGGIGYAVTGTVFNTGNFLVSPTYFGGGGGASVNGAGGLGGGGNGSVTSGTPNTGGGGGGDGNSGTVGKGGSGVVYLAFPV